MRLIGCAFEAADCKNTKLATATALNEGLRIVFMAWSGQCVTKLVAADPFCDNLPRLLASTTALLILSVHATAANG
jgi:hypothetical protein